MSSPSSQENEGWRLEAEEVVKSAMKASQTCDSLSDQTDGNASFLRAARAGNLDKVLEYLKGSTDINTSNANGLNALHLASKEGHVNIVTELLKRGANVDAATKKGNTALHIASLAGQEEVVKILVQNNAKVNVQSQNGFTPLYMAAQEDHAEVVKFLLSNGASQSLATEDGFTPLAVALQQGHDKVVAVLLENDSRGKVRLPALHIAAKKDDTKAAALLLQNEHNVDNTSKSGFTPLHIAAHYGNINVGNLLIQKGADSNYKARNSICPLHVSSKWGRVNMVTLLLDNNGNIEARTRDGLTPLHCGARSGHEQVVDILLERGALVGAKTKNGLTPLHMAAQGDHVDCGRLLLYHKAPIDDVTVDYLTPLHVAAHCGNVRTAKLLLDRKCEVNARALNGFTPLHIACKKNRIKVVELLLKYGASIEATTESGLTPLHVASFMGHMNIVIYLIQHGANPDFTTVRGETALHLAARANQTDIIRILLRNGANVDAKAREQQTALHIASRLGNVDTVVLLLQHGASPDATTKDLYTPLHIAAKEGQEEVASVLLEHGASLNLTTKKGFTPLHIAAKYGNIKVARLLLQKEADPDVQGKNGLTPLHVATHYNHVNVALLLLESGASPHSSAKNGYTPLHIAAKKNQMDIATTLLEYGAKPNAESKNGFTPLHLASQEGHTDMVSLLLEHKGDVNCKAKNGLTPMHLAAQEDKVPVAEILVKYGSEIDPQTKAGYTPLHTACHFGQINMIRFLLEHGASVNATTKLGYTPLHQAAQQGHVLVINLLLKYKASPNAVTNSGQTPLSIAQRLGYISVVETLKHITEVTTVSTDEKIKVVSPETMEEGPMTDSEDEGGEDTLADTSFSRQSITADMEYLMRDDSTAKDSSPEQFGGQELYSPNTPYSAFTPYPGQANSTEHFLFPDSVAYEKMQQRYSGNSIPRSTTGDSLKRKYDDHTLKYDESYIPLAEEEVIQAKSAVDSYAMMTSSIMTDDTKMMSYSGTSFDSTLHADNIAVDRTPQHSGFLVSFMVDARGGAMRGCRHSGVRIIVPPRKACMPTRVTCKLVKKEKLTHPPPLMEGEALASRILEMGPVGAKFLGPVIIEVPHFASLRDREREIHILRSDNGETWHEHTVEATEDLIHETLNGSFEDLESAEDLYQKRITRILTTDFPQYFAVVTRIRQEKNMIGNEGGMLSSTVVPQVQAVFPDGALTKKISVGLQVQPVQPELVSKMLGNRVAVSPIVTLEPRRRKFHKAITLTIPVPKASQKGMINQYSGDAPTLRLLCSITDNGQDESGTSPAQWEDITSNHPLTFVNDCVQFTTSVSARYWLMDCQNINEAAKMASELYRECTAVPFMSKFVVFAKRKDTSEARLRVFCMTDDRMDKTLENQEHFNEVARSRDVEILEGKSQYLEMAGNLVPVTKSGEQLHINFHAFRENRLPFVVRVRDSNLDPIGRLAFMREPKVARGEAPQSPICNLNIKLPDLTKGEQITEIDTEELKRRYDLMRSGGPATEESIAKAELRLTDIADVLQGDWIILARQLHITEEEITKIQTEYNYVSEQALVMLHLWVQKNGPNATGNELERALRKIGRDDVVRKCMYNIETVTDEVERSLAKVQLDQQGFDEFKAELEPSRDSTLQRDMSLDVSYDEQDIVKESESAEEESGSESSSVVENKELNIKNIDEKPLKQEELSAQLAESEQWISQEDMLDSKTAVPMQAEPVTSPKRYAEQFPPGETDIDDYIVQEKVAAVEAAATAAEIPATPQVKKETLESEPYPKVDVRDFEDILDDGTLVKRKVTTTSLFQTVTELTTTQTVDGIHESRKEIEKPVGLDILEEILEIPPGVDSNQEKPETEVSETETKDTTSNGIPITRKVITTKVVKKSALEPEVSRDITESEPRSTTEVDQTEEVLDDGTLVRRKITTTKSVKTVTETITTVTAEGRREQRNVVEEPIAVEIIEEVSQTPQGVDPNSVNENDYETSVDETEDKTPEGIPVKHKLIIKRISKPQVDKEVIESEPQSIVDVEEKQEVLDDGTVIKRKITTSKIVKIVTEVVITQTSEGPKEEKVATEQPVEVIVVEEVTEIPPGLEEDIVDIAPITEPEVEETHDVLPDGVPVTRRVVLRKILKPQISTETIESEPDRKVDVEEKCDVLDDGTIIKRKITKTTIVKIITEIVTTETREGPKVERFAKEEPVEIIVLEEVLEIPPGLDENSDLLTEAVVTETTEVLPEGIPVTRKIVTRKVVAPEPQVTREFIESEPRPVTDVKEKEEVLDDGTLVRSKISTTKVMKTVTEVVVTETPEGHKEQRNVVEEPISVEIVEEVSQTPPGVDPSSVNENDYETSVDETDDKTIEGVPVKHKLITKRITKAPVSKEVVESEPESKVDVEEKEEVLDDGTIVKRKITTSRIVKIVTEIITSQTPEGPKEEKVATEQPVEVIVVEEVTEIPPGLDEDIVDIAPITEPEVEETHDVLPDGVPVTRRVVSRKIFKPQISRETVESEPESKVDVEEKCDVLDDGTVLKRKITTTRVVKIFTEVVTTETREGPKVEKFAREEPVEIIVLEEVLEIPPGLDENSDLLTEAVVTETTEVLPEGIPVTRKIVTRKVAAPEPQVTREFIESEPQPVTDVKEKEEVLDDGTLVRSKISTTKVMKSVTEVVITETPEGRKEQRNVVEEPISVEIVEEVSQTPPGVDPSSVNENDYETSVDETDDKTPEGVPVKHRLITKRITKAPVSKEVVESEPESKVDVEEKEEVLDDGTIVKRKITTSRIVKIVTEIITTQTSEGPKEEKVATEQPVEVIVVEEVTEIPPGVEEDIVDIAPITEPDIQETHDVLPDGVPVTRRVVSRKIFKPQISRETVESEPESKVNVEEKRDVLDDGTVIKRKITTTTLVKIFTDVVTTETREGPKVEKFAREEPVEIIVLEEVLEIPPGLDENSDLLTEAVVTETTEVLPEGIPVNRKIVTRKVAAPEPKVTREFTESDLEPKIDVQEREEVLDDGTLMKHKITTTTAIRLVTEIITTETHEGKKIQKIATEQPVEIIIEEEVFQIPPGFDFKHAVLQPIDEDDIDEIQDYLPDGVPLTRRIIPRRYIVEKPIEQKPVEAVSAEVVESVPSAIPLVETEEALPEGAEVTETEEVQPDGTVHKKRIIKSIVHSTIVIRIITTRPDGTVTEEVITEDLVPSKDDEESVTEKLDDEIPEGAEVDEYDETLPNGTVVRKRVIRIVRENVVITKIYTYGPDGSVSEEILTEELPEKKPVTEIIEAEDEKPVEAAASITTLPFEDDEIPEGADVDEFDETLPDGTVVRKRVIKYMIGTKMVTKVYTFKPDGEVNVQVLTEDTQPRLVTDFDLKDFPEGEGEEVEEVLEDGTIVRKRIIRSVQQRTKIRRVGPDGQIIEEVVTEDVPDAATWPGEVTEVVETSEVSTVPEQTDETAEKMGIRVYTDTIEGEPEVDTDVQEFEETLPDGTVVKRRVVKTKQRKTVVRRLIMEGPEDELEGEPDIVQYMDTDEGEPEISTDVQEFEETLPDGTIVKRKVITTSEHQLSTQTKVSEGSGDFPFLDQRLPITEDEIIPDEQQEDERLPSAPRKPVTETDLDQERAPVEEAARPDVEDAKSQGTDVEEPFSPTTKETFDLELTKVTSSSPVSHSPPEVISPTKVKELQEEVSPVHEHPVDMRRMKLAVGGSPTDFIPEEPEYLSDSFTDSYHEQATVDGEDTVITETSITVPVLADESHTEAKYDVITEATEVEISGTVKEETSFTTIQKVTIGHSPVKEEISPSFEEPSPVPAPMEPEKHDLELITDLGKKADTVEVCEGKSTPEHIEYMSFDNIGFAGKDNIDGKEVSSEEDTQLSPTTFEEADKDVKKVEFVQHIDREIRTEIFTREMKQSIDVASPEKKDLMDATTVEPPPVSEPVNIVYEKEFPLETIDKKSDKDVEHIVDHQVDDVHSADKQAAGEDVPHAEMVIDIAKDEISSEAESEHSLDYNLEELKEQARKTSTKPVLTESSSESDESDERETAADRFSLEVTESYEDSKEKIPEPYECIDATYNAAVMTTITGRLSQGTAFTTELQATKQPEGFRIGTTEYVEDKEEGKKSVAEGYDPSSEKVMEYNRESEVQEVKEVPVSESHEILTESMTLSYTTAVTSIETSGEYHEMEETLQESVTSMTEEDTSPEKDSFLGLGHEAEKPPDTEQPSQPDSSIDDLDLECVSIQTGAIELQADILTRPDSSDENIDFEMISTKQPGIESDIADGGSVESDTQYKTEPTFIHEDTTDSLHEITPASEEVKLPLRTSVSSSSSDSFDQTESATIDSEEMSTSYDTRGEMEDEMQTEDSRMIPSKRETGMPESQLDEVGREETFTELDKPVLHSREVVHEDVDMTYSVEKEVFKKKEDKFDTFAQIEHHEEISMEPEYERDDELKHFDSENSTTKPDVLTETSGLITDVSVTAKDDVVKAITEVYEIRETLEPSTSYSPEISSDDVELVQALETVPCVSPDVERDSEHETITSIETEEADEKQEVKVDFTVDITSSSSHVISETLMTAESREDSALVQHDEQIFADSEIAVLEKLSTDKDDLGHAEEIDTKKELTISEFEDKGSYVVDSTTDEMHMIKKTEMFTVTREESSEDLPIDIKSQGTPIPSEVEDTSPYIEEHYTPVQMDAQTLPDSKIDPVDKASAFKDVQITEDSKDMKDKDKKERFGIADSDYTTQQTFDFESQTETKITTTQSTQQFYYGVSSKRIHTELNVGELVDLLYEPSRIKRSEDAPHEQKTSETIPPEAKPSEQKTSETIPPEAKPSEQKTSETILPEAKPHEPKASETTPPPTQEPYPSDSAPSQELVKCEERSPEKVEQEEVTSIPPKPAAVLEQEIEDRSHGLIYEEEKPTEHILWSSGEKKDDLAEDYTVDVERISVQTSHSQDTSPSIVDGKEASSQDAGGKHLSSMSSEDLKTSITSTSSSEAWVEPTLLAATYDLDTAAVSRVVTTYDLSPDSVERSLTVVPEQKAILSSPEDEVFEFELAAQRAAQREMMEAQKLQSDSDLMAKSSDTKEVRTEILSDSKLDADVEYEKPDDEVGKIDESKSFTVIKDEQSVDLSAMADETDFAKRSEYVSVEPAVEKIQDEGATARVESPFEFVIESDLSGYEDYMATMDLLKKEEQFMEHEEAVSTVYEGKLSRKTDIVTETYLSEKSDSFLTDTNIKQYSHVETTFSVMSVQEKSDVTAPQTFDDLLSKPSETPERVTTRETAVPQTTLHLEEPESPTFEHSSPVSSSDQSDQVQMSPLEFQPSAPPLPDLIQASPAHTPEDDQAQTLPEESQIMQEQEIIQSPVDEDRYIYTNGPTEVDYYPDQDHPIDGDQPVVVEQPDIVPAGLAVDGANMPLPCAESESNSSSESEPEHDIQQSGEQAQQEELPLPHQEVVIADYHQEHQHVVITEPMDREVSRSPVEALVEISSDLAADEPTVLTESLIEDMNNTEQGDKMLASDHTLYDIEMPSEEVSMSPMHSSRADQDGAVSQADELSSISSMKEQESGIVLADEMSRTHSSKDADMSFSFGDEKLESSETEKSLELDIAGTSDSVLQPEGIKGESGLEEPDAGMVRFSQIAIEPYVQIKTHDVESPESDTVGSDKVDDTKIEVKSGKAALDSDATFGYFGECVKIDGQDTVDLEDQWQHQQQELCEAKFTEDITLEPELDQACALEPEDIDVDLPDYPEDLGMDDMDTNSERPESELTSDQPESELMALAEGQDEDQRSLLDLQTGERMERFDIQSDEEDMERPQSPVPNASHEISWDESNDDKKQLQFEEYGDESDNEYDLEPRKPQKKIQDEFVIHQQAVQFVQTVIDEAHEQVKDLKDEETPEDGDNLEKLEDQTSVSQREPEPETTETGKISEIDSTDDQDKHDQSEKVMLHSDLVYQPQAPDQPEKTSHDVTDAPEESVRFSAADDIVLSGQKTAKLVTQMSEDIPEITVTQHMHDEPDEDMDEEYPSPYVPTKDSADMSGDDDMPSESTYGDKHLEEKVDSYEEKERVVRDQMQDDDSIEKERHDAIISEPIQDIKSTEFTTVSLEEEIQSQKSTSGDTVVSELEQRVSDITESHSEESAVDEKTGGESTPQALSPEPGQPQPQIDQFITLDGSIITLVGDQDVQSPDDQGDSSSVDSFATVVAAQQEEEEDRLAEIASMTSSFHSDVPSSFYEDHQEPVISIDVRDKDIDLEDAEQEKMSESSSTSDKFEILEKEDFDPIEALFTTEHLEERYDIIRHTELESVPELSEHSHSSSDNVSLQSPGITANQFFSKSGEHDDISVTSSLIEFEHLEKEALQFSPEKGSQESLQSPHPLTFNKSAERDDISISSSLAEFEQLEGIVRQVDSFDKITAESKFYEEHSSKSSLSEFESLEKQCSERRESVDSDIRPLSKSSAHSSQSSLQEFERLEEEILIDNELEAEAQKVVSLLESGELINEPVESEAIVDEPEIPEGYQEVPVEVFSIEPLIDMILQEEPQALPEPILEMPPLDLTREMDRDSLVGSEEESQQDVDKIILEASRNVELFEGACALPQGVLLPKQVQELKRDGSMDSEGTQSSLVEHSLSSGSGLDADIDSLDGQDDGDYVLDQSVSTATAIDAQAIKDMEEDSLQDSESRSGVIDTDSLADPDSIMQISAESFEFDQTVPQLTDDKVTTKDPVATAVPSIMQSSVDSLDLEQQGLQPDQAAMVRSTDSLELDQRVPESASKENFDTDSLHSQPIKETYDQESVHSQQAEVLDSDSLQGDLMQVSAESLEPEVPKPRHILNLMDMSAESGAWSQSSSLMSHETVKSNDSDPYFKRDLMQISAESPEYEKDTRQESSEESPDSQDRLHTFKSVSHETTEISSSYEFSFSETTETDSYPKSSFIDSEGNFDSETDVGREYDSEGNFYQKTHQIQQTQYQEKKFFTMTELDIMRQQQIEARRLELEKSSASFSTIEPGVGKITYTVDSAEGARETVTKIAVEPFVLSSEFKDKGDESDSSSHSSTPTSESSHSGDCYCGPVTEPMSSQKASAKTEKTSVRFGDFEAAQSIPSSDRTIMEESQKDASASYAAKRVASIEDDEMREFDPEEHLEMLAHGIPEQYAQKTGPGYVDPEFDDSSEDEITEYPGASFGDVYSQGQSEDGTGPVSELQDESAGQEGEMQSSRVLMKKRIHKKTIIRDGKEETIVTEDSHVEQDDDAPHELREDIRNIIDQFMEGTGEIQLPSSTQVETVVSTTTTTSGTSKQDS